MSKPEININARAYGYLLLGEVLEIITKRADACLDLKNDSAEILMDLVKDSIEDFRTEVSETTVHFKDDGSFKLESDVISFLVDKDPVDEDTLALTLSMILERLESLEQVFKKT